MKTMPISDLDAIFIVSDNIRHRRISDEGLVLRQTEGEVLIINDSAIDILDRIDGKTTVSGVTDSLLDIYNVEPEELQRDISRYLLELAELGILEHAGVP